MTVDFEAQVHLADLRARVLRGERPTAIEYRDLMMDLRRGRDMAAAATRAAAAKMAKVKREDAKAARPKLNLAELFGSVSLRSTDTPNEEEAT